MKAITARQIHTARAGRHRVAGAPGLYVDVRPSGARAWVVRLWNGARETMRGLGSVCDVTLTEAKRQALTLRAAVATGTEPAKRAVRVRRAPVRTWADAFDHFMRTREIRKGTRDGYRSTWRVNVAAALGSRAVAQTTREDVITLITSCKGSAANKSRKLLATVGKCAVSLGWIDVNPADDAINAALPAAARKTTDGRRRPMPHGEIGAFLAGLPDTAAADALRMLALTGCRLGDVTAAEWSEIDAEGAVWTVSAARQKSAKDHPVPLTAPVRAILERQRSRSERYVFPSTRVASRPVSGPTVRSLFPDAYDLHGLRGSLKTWSAETGQDREATEAVLAHSDGTSTERRYQHSNLIVRRRALLDAWSAYIGGEGA